MSRSALAAMLAALACGPALAGGDVPAVVEPDPPYRPLAATFLPPIAGAVAGSPADGRLFVLGGYGRTSFTVTGGRLPEGVAVSGDGSLTGTFQAPGAYGATVRVDTEDGRSTDVPVTLDVTPLR